MRGLVKTASILLVACSISGCSKAEERQISEAKTEEGFILSTAKPPADEPFHIAVMDQGPPIESSYLWLKGLAEEFQKMGYISQDVDLDSAPDDFDGYYDYLLGRDLGDIIEFDSESYFVGVGEDEEVARKLKKEKDEGKLDLVASTGTMPGQFLKELDLGVPFLVSLATDPVASDIIDSAEDSGNENIWALVEEEPCARKFGAYYSMLGFKKIGLVCVDEYDIMGGNTQYRNKANELGVKLHEIKFKESETESEDYSNKLIERIKEAPLDKLDAMLFAYGSITANEAGEVSKILEEKGIPFLVGDGDDIVKNGGLIFLSYFDYEAYGRQAAKVASSVFNGKKAGELPQKFQSPSRIVLNLSTAKKMGFDTDLALLRAASVIYK